jgi:hypothetical protein
MTERVYRGGSIDRAPGSGYWRAFIVGRGWRMADTLAGLKSLIRDTLEGNCDG